MENTTKHGFRPINLLLKWRVWNQQNRTFLSLSYLTHQTFSFPPSLRRLSHRLFASTSSSIFYHKHWLSKYIIFQFIEEVTKKKQHYEECFEMAWKLTDCLTNFREMLNILFIAYRHTHIEILFAIYFSKMCEVFSSFLSSLLLLLLFRWLQF